MNRIIMIPIILILSGISSFFIFPGKSPTLMLVNELIFEAAAVLALLSAPKLHSSDRRRLIQIFVILFFADLIYGLNHLGFYVNEVVTQLIEYLYLSFIACLLMFLRRGLQVSKLTKQDYLVLTFNYLMFFALSFTFVLLPFYTRPIPPEFLILVTSTIYRVLEAAVFSLAITLSLKVTRRLEMWFVLSVVLSCIASFALSYNDGVLMGETYPLHEYGWLVAVGGLMVSMFLAHNVKTFWSHKRDPINGVRARLALILFFGNILLLLALLFLKLYQVADAFQLSTTLFIVFCFWVMSQAVSSGFARRMSNIIGIMLENSISLESAPTAQANGSSTSEMLLPIMKNRSGIFELDRIIENHNKFITNYNRNIVVNFEEHLRKVRLQSLADMAKQVTHDIRSPLTALDVAVADASSLPEEARILVRSATQRIKDISNNLLKKGQVLQSLEEPLIENRSVQLLSSLVEVLVSEKRVQFRPRPGIEIEACLNAAYGIFANIDGAAFKRLLSNLINNSVESLDGKGKVEVCLTSKDEYACLTVTDNGRGIPDEILENIGKKGFSYGKSGIESGSGLGVYFAKLTVESWGGALKIDSKVGVGTTVTILLPQSPVPAWFLSKLSISPEIQVVILDDDSSVHQVWKGRLGANFQNRVKHFRAPEELRAWVNANGKDHTLFLTDFELLGHKETGLDLIQELDIAHQSVLVTSWFEEPKIVEQCEQLGVKLLPKALAGFVPLT